jgi:hypothetical protein
MMQCSKENNKNEVRIQARFPGKTQSVGVGVVSYVLCHHDELAVYLKHRVEEARVACVDQTTDHV